MVKPIIKINDSIYEMIDVKGSSWRLIAEFEDNKSNLMNPDFVDKHADLLANFFVGLSANDILDNLDLADILKIYYDCYQYMRWLIFSKLQALDSTQDVGDATQA